MTGRPRDSTIDARALDAARQLLLDEGFAGTTVQAVAKRSGVHASAIYRRWPTRAELIQDAALHDLAASRFRPTGDLRRDLRRFARSYLKTFDTPLVRAAVPGLLAARAAGERPRPSQTWTHLSMRPQFHEILAAAPDDAVDRSIDPEDVFDLVLGTILVRLVVDVRQPPPVERTVELLVRLLAPRR